jgi:hypothetical protein
MKARRFEKDKSMTKKAMTSHTLKKKKKKKKRGYL